MRMILPMLAVAAAATACGSPTEVAPVPLAELEAAPLAVVVNGQEVVLSPYLWRDFMPFTPPDGRPMIAILRLESADGAPLAGTVSIDAAWVVNDDEVWTGSVREHRLAPPPPMYYEAVMRGGPKWGPGITVDVVVRVRDSTGEPQLIRATNVPIHRTE